MKPSRLLKITSGILTLSTAVTLTTTVVAEEGAVGHYLPGGIATMADRAPDKEGWVLESMFLHYQGNTSASKKIPVANLIIADVQAKSDAFLLGGFYTFDQKVLGAKYSMGGFVSYVWMDVKGQATTRTGTKAKHDKVDGIGDLSLIPAIFSWEFNDCWKMNALLPIYAPTGDYEVGRMANQGLNHWTFDPVVGAAYSNAQTGLNFTAFSGLAFSTKNNDTDYQNGTVFHIDTSVQQLLPVGPGFLGLGLEAFYYQQITGDRGSGELLGDFKSMTTGIGPVISYILPVKESTFVAEVRWLKELNTTNRLEGDYLWLKLIYQF